MAFQQKPLEKSISVHFENEWSERPVLTLESALNVGYRLILDNIISKNG